MHLRAGFAAVDRVRPGQRTPFFARTLAASTTARDHSMAPCWPSRSSTARCSRRHSPACVQATKRRCARSEEHTSELQSRQYLVCRLLLEKKKHQDINLK